MFPIRSVLFTYAACSLLLSPLEAQDRRETILKTKSVTALVDLGPIGSGTAFCIDESGLFLTNFHVVASAGLGGEVTLVIDPSLESERTVKATVIKYDEENDLALLQTREDRKWEALKFGDAEQLVETDNVTVFGYPFGRMLSSEPGGYPSISINLGRISALRRSEGKLKLLQIDAVVNPGNSGGPALNQSGEVIGVVVAKIRASQVNFCIPSNIVKEFLSTPAVVLKTPKLTYRDLSDELAIEFEVVPLPGSEPLESAELVLEYAGEETPPAAAKNLEATFRSTTRIMLPEEYGKFHVSVLRAGRLTDFSTGDLTFAVGSKSFHLSEVRRIERRGTQHLVADNSSRKTIGQLSQFEALAEAGDLEVGDLASADRIDIFCEKKVPETLNYRLLLKGKTAEFPAISGSFPVRSVPLGISDRNEWFDRYSDSLQEVVLRMYIEGEDSIHVRANGIELEHLTDSKPGFKDTDGKYILVNGKKWYPDWYFSSADSSEEADSEKYHLKLGGGDWRMTVLKQLNANDHKHNPGRGKVAVEQHNIGMSITVNDEAVGGGIYEFLLKKHLLPLDPPDSPPGSTKGGEWNFEQVESDLVPDVSQADHPARIEGTTHHVPSPVGHGLRFAATSNLKASSHFNIEFDKPFSLSAWIKPEADRAVVLSQMQSGGTFRGFDFFTDRRSVWMHLIHQWDKNAIRVQAQRQYRFGEWVQVVITYDGSQKGEGIRIYYDGEEVPVQISNDSLNNTIANELPLALGGRHTDHWWEGAIDEVRLYDRVLIPEEAAFLADPQRQAEESLKQGLLCHWPFEDAESGEIREASGKSEPISLKELPPAAEIVAGRDGKVVQLRRGGFVDCGDVGSFERDQPFSFGGWVLAGENGNYRGRFVPVAKMETGERYRGYRLLIENGTVKVHLIHDWQARRHIEVNSTQKLAPGQWHHVMVSYDGSALAKGVTVYVDGTPIPGKTVFDRLDGTMQCGVPLVLGNCPSISHGSGQLDNILVVDGLLSPEEIAKLAGK